jgi:hypothetical protein
MNGQVRIRNAKTAAPIRCKNAAEVYTLLIGRVMRSALACVIWSSSAVLPCACRQANETNPAASSPAASSSTAIRPFLLKSMQVESDLVSRFMDKLQVAIIEVDVLAVYKTLHPSIRRHISQKQFEACFPEEALFNAIALSNLKVERGLMEPVCESKYRGVYRVATVMTKGGNVEVRIPPTVFTVVIDNDQVWVLHVTGQPFTPVLDDLWLHGLDKIGIQLQP